MQSVRATEMDRQVVGGELRSFWRQPPQGVMTSGPGPITRHSRMRFPPDPYQRCDRRGFGALTPRIGCVLDIAAADRAVSPRTAAPT